MGAGFMILRPFQSIYEVFMRNNKSTVDRICETCEEPKKASEFQYNYSKNCKPCVNAAAKAERNQSNVSDLASQKRAEALWF